MFQFRSLVPCEREKVPFSVQKFIREKGLQPQKKAASGEQMGGLTTIRLNRVYSRPSLTMAFLCSAAALLVFS